MPVKRDLANIINKQRKTGIPQSSRDSFELLSKANLLPVELSQNLQKMVGLRNVAVHDYQTLNLAIVKHVVENRLNDFEDFCNVMKSIGSE
ncbi:type VII toxin-antitoxin system HepT family RNase toxin [Echinimonas agarilytica]|uniref:type VII toxin-antitoxin system HepT family RNase toxin n=1 Tax=Echinimonas agarilytica TaxID=1215918 RepID=UPI0032E4634A